MQAAHLRALEVYVANVNASVQMIPSLDDLKQRLSDKHAVTYDPICMEAVEYLTALETQLRETEIMVSNLLSVVSSAVLSIHKPGASE